MAERPWRTIAWRRDTLARPRRRRAARRRPRRARAHRRTSPRASAPRRADARPPDARATKRARLCATRTISSCRPSIRPRGRMEVGVRVNCVDGCIPSDLATGSSTRSRRSAAALCGDDARARRADADRAQRFYVHGQAKNGDRYVSAARSRFIPARCSRLRPRRLAARRRRSRAASPRRRSTSPRACGRCGSDPLPRSGRRWREARMRDLRVEASSRGTRASGADWRASLSTPRPIVRTKGLDEVPPTSRRSTPSRLRPRRVRSSRRARTAQRRRGASPRTWT